MSKNIKKKGNKYQELGNFEEGESIEYHNNQEIVKNEKNSAEIKSAELPPKIHHNNDNKTTNGESTEIDSQKETNKHSISSERKRDIHKINSFSPKTYKKTMGNIFGSRENLIALDNNIKELSALLRDNVSAATARSIEKKASVENNLIEKLKGDQAICKNETILLKLKKLWDDLQSISIENRNNNHEILQEIIMRVLQEQSNHNKDIIVMLTADDSKNEKEPEENGDNVNALRESYHEFSLKKLMQMSFVELTKLII